MSCKAKPHANGVSDSEKNTGILVANVAIVSSAGLYKNTGITDLYLTKGDADDTCAHDVMSIDD